jgi:ferredoxin-NADP reductase
MNAILKETFPKAKEIKGFIFKLEESLNYIPGQYIMIRFPDDEIKRAFSIVEYDTEANELLIVVKKNGEFTQRLFESQEGTVLEMYGPYGRFVLPKSKNKKIIMIAGGIGITPLYNMAINNLDKDITIFYSAKSKDSASFTDELSSTDLRHTYTSLGERLTPKEVYSGDALYYICGPLSMIENFRNGLLELGVKEDNIKSEDFT